MNQDPYAPTVKLIDVFSAPDELAVGTGPKISVNQMVSRVAFFYERIRNAIEFNEEHLFRKNAIERILKRRLLIQLEKRDLAQDLVYELMRGRYLPNNAVPESRIGDVRRILDKYAALMKEVSVHFRGERRRSVRDWLVSIESYEIEKALVSHRRDEAIVEFMYDRVREQVSVEESELHPDEKNIQIFAGIHRALLKSDDAVIRYYLWRLHVPSWETPSADDLLKLAGDIEQMRNAIEWQVEHPIRSRMTRLMKRYSIMFIVLRYILEEAGSDADELIHTPDILEARIRKAIAKRYTSARTKIRRTVIRSIIYIFITKMIIGIIIEFPYDVFVASAVEWVPLIVNVTFHPILLAFIALTVRVPSEKNTKKIIDGINAFLRGADYGDLFEGLRKPVRRRRLTFVFSFIYLVTYIITFGLIIWGLSQFGFNVVSMVIFILFLSIVSFFGLKVRGIARELVIESKREGIFAVLVDFFAVPILHLGRWISEKAPKINILIFILDFILEAPFKTFIEIIEQWFSFIREKREEMY